MENKNTNTKYIPNVSKQCDYGIYKTSRLIDCINLKCPNFQTLAKRNRKYERKEMEGNDSLSLCMDILNSERA